MKTTSFNNGRNNSSSLFRRGIGGVSFFFLLFLLLFASCDDLEDTDTPRVATTVCPSKPEQPNSTSSAKDSST